MRQPSLPRRARRLGRALAVAAALAAAAVFGAGAACVDNIPYWVCFDPGTGHDGNYYDSSHYVDGMIDPCHCYDPCGPANTCPIIVDAGPPPPGAMCDAGADGP
jgi:hypothetical protein